MNKPTPHAGGVYTRDADGSLKQVQVSTHSPDHPDHEVNKKKAAEKAAAEAAAKKPAKKE